MTRVAKLAHELHIGDVLSADVLPARTVQEVVPSAEMLTIHTLSVVPPDDDTTGTYAETVSRDKVVEIETI